MVIIIIVGTVIWSCTTSHIMYEIYLIERKKRVDYFTSVYVLYRELRVYLRLYLPDSSLSLYLSGRDYVDYSLSGLQIWVQPNLDLSKPSTGGRRVREGCSLSVTKILSSFLTLAGVLRGETPQKKRGPLKCSKRVTGVDILFVYLVRDKGSHFVCYLTMTPKTPSTSLSGRLFSCVYKLTVSIPCSQRKTS